MAKDSKVTLQEPEANKKKTDSKPSSERAVSVTSGVHQRKVTSTRDLVVPKTKLKNVFFGRFPDRKEEQLYQEYMRKQKLKIIPAFVFTAIVYLVSRLALESVVFDATVHLARVIIHGLFIVLIFITLILLTYAERLSVLAINLCVITLWILVTSSLLFDVAVQSHPRAASGSVGWVQVVIFTTFVVVPWKLRYCVGTSVVIATVHSVELMVLWLKRVHVDDEELAHRVLAEQLVADFLLFSGAISLGILVFAFSERKQRRSFIESKKSHSVSRQIEKQHREQKMLLRSVLPKYVARLMMMDMEGMGDKTDVQFRKIYMQRYENISILFADIVGFTAISSSVTAAELVKILNQLFATFDDLANKYHQQRIKILGDCYYCVCGIERVELRPDHAVLCIHMGMAMVDAISEVRKNTGKEVNMRVGIHTGSVLAGVMGQRQWQYDVLGKEVTLANHMESGGLPARVHLSEATKNQLDGQFELEPGNGEDRDDYLKMANVRTYMVKCIVKPYPEGTLDADLPLLAKLKAEASKERDVAEDTMSSEESIEESAEGQAGADTANLKIALFDRRRSRTAMQKLSFFTTWFHDPLMESRYRQRREHFSGASMGALCLVLLLTSAAKLAVLPETLISVFVFIVAEIVLIIMAIVSSVGIIQSKRIPEALISFGMLVESDRLARLIWGVSAILILIAADSAMIIQCDVERARYGLQNASNLHIVDPNDLVCPYPAYFVHVVHLILLGVSSVVQIEHMTKMLVILFTTSMYCVFYIVVFGAIFDFNDAVVYEQDEKVVPSKIELSIQLISASLALVMLNRKMEEISRRLFIWREEAEEKTEVARKERHKNEELVYNILPGHVARYFIGQHRHHMDLYSYGYDEAAVMFAACPNFHDFYNESDVNNQGLECLRLLNEIISDYDELLDRPKFKSKITKIKTVGPTYMAASGMVTSHDHDTGDGAVQSRWQHLDDLVQFAMAMKEELRLINEQSFNNFILRIGINHGPIIAGVIGARKPHYDIWGNTVNVASRMESTGMPDTIQVVEETKEILEGFGYYFKKRGLVKVKGKGQLMTYFLEGQDKYKTRLALSMPGRRDTSPSVPLTRGALGGGSSTMLLPRSATTTAVELQPSMGLAPPPVTLSIPSIPEADEPSPGLRAGQVTITVEPEEPKPLPLSQDLPLNLSPLLQPPGKGQAQQLKKGDMMSIAGLLSVTPTPQCSASSEYSESSTNVSEESTSQALASISSGHLT